MNNDLPATNVQERVVALARSQPGGAHIRVCRNWHDAAPGWGVAESTANIDIRHVPSRGTNFSPDVVAGRLSMMFGPPTSMLPLAREGKVRALAVTSLQRQTSAPDLPTMAEFPGSQVSR